MAIHLRTSKGYSPYHYKTTPLSPSHMFHSQTIPPLQSQGTSNYKTYTFLRCKHSDHQSLPHQSSPSRSEEHTSELQSRGHLVCRLLLEKKKTSDRNPVAQETIT